MSTCAASSVHGLITGILEQPGAKYGVVYELRPDVVGRVKANAAKDNKSSAMWSKQNLGAGRDTVVSFDTIALQPVFTGYRQDCLVI